MKRTSTIILGLALLGAASLAHAAPNCTIKLKGNDQMQFDLKTVTVSAACPSIAIELTHTGKLAAQVMGHNVVVSKTADVSAISADGMKAGVAAGYVPKGDARVLAATPVIGGGASTKAKFAGGKLKAGGDYTYFCSFPGHSGIMKGTLVVTK
jgi:azurin